MTDRAITNNVLIVDEAGKPVGVTAGALNTSGGQSANTTYVTTQVSVTGVAATLIAAVAGRKFLLLQSLSANTQSVWIGAATVTTVTGFELKPGAEKWFSAADVPVHLLQAISTSGTQTIVVTVGS